MTGEVFEYFFDPDELEPFYSELSEVTRRSRPPFQPGDAKPSLGDVKTCRHNGVKQAGDDSTKPEVHVASCNEPVGQQVDVSEQAELVQPTNEVNSSKHTTAPKEQHTTRTRVRQFLSVHALGQYVFCARSAILAAEAGDDRDADEPLPRLTYLPNFDRERIEEWLQKKMGQLGLAMVCGISSACLMASGVLSQDKVMFYPSLLVFIGSTIWFLNLSIAILRLAARRRAAIKAESREPVPDVESIQAVNWWSMLNAGYEPVTYDRPFRHPEFPLEGCPWRVLERDSQRIPVIRSGSNMLGGSKGELYPKHQIRLVAYALLLEAVGHVQVPFGIVVPNDSAHGLALQITDELREQTIRTLHEFSVKLVDSQQHQVEPRLPDQRNRCVNCRHGCPQPIDVATINRSRQAGKQVVVLVSSKGETFHCDCGDRFGAAPRHANSTRLGLMASLQ